MALPALLDNTVIQALFRGTITGNPIDTNPLLNVQWFVYQKGFGPEPAGIPLNDMAFRALGRWATFWRPFQSGDWNYESCTLRAVANFSPRAPDRYNLTLGSQWTDNTVQTAGGVASPSTPSFNAFGVRKLTAAPGRGKQGQIRIGGVPIASTLDNQVDPIVLATLAAALTPTSLTLNVSTGMAFSDALLPVIIDGKLVNSNPGHPPLFYVQFIEGYAPTSTIASQVTRKQGRRRS